MLNTQILANTVLMLAFEEKINVTPMKLQKLIYFIYKDFLKTTGTKLFNERFEKWKYGPVLPSIYYEFSGFKSKPIDKFARDANGSVIVIDLDYDSQVNESILKIWNRYKRLSGIELSQLTHSPDSAWSNAQKKGLDTLNDEDIKNEKEF